MSVHPCTECVKYELFPCVNTQNNLKLHATKCCICLEQPDIYLTYYSNCNFCIQCYIKMFRELVSITNDTLEKYKHKGKIIFAYSVLITKKWYIGENFIDKDYREYVCSDSIIICPRQKIECIKHEDFPSLNVQNNFDLQAIKCSTCFTKPIIYLSLKFYCNFCLPCFINMLYTQQLDIKNPAQVLKYKLFIGISNSIIAEVDNTIKNHLDHDNPEYASSNFVVTMYKK